MTEILGMLFRRDAATAVFLGSISALALVIILGCNPPATGNRDEIRALLADLSPVLQEGPREVRRPLRFSSAAPPSAVPRLLHEGWSNR